MFTVSSSAHQLNFSPTLDFLQAANQLEALKVMSKVVADTGEFEQIERYQPIDATTNPTLLLKAVGLPTYSHLLDDAVAQEKSSNASAVADRLATMVGCEILKIVPGRVSTEVDARLSYNTQATVDKALHIIDLYSKAGHDPSRIYIKVRVAAKRLLFEAAGIASMHRCPCAHLYCSPSDRIAMALQIASTWEGIRACDILQNQGIDCNMTLLFSFAQAAACADAGAALISPFVGRILDWYKAHKGREYEPHEDPGVLSVKRIYAYYKQYAYRTSVMAASFRNVGEVRELAGCDAITISPALLKELEESTDPLPFALWPSMGGCSDPRYSLGADSRHVFDQMHVADAMAVDKLEEGVKNFASDQEKLEAMISDMVAAVKK